MQIAIISDIHDNIPNLNKCLNWCKENNVQQIICCGDVTNSEALNFLAVNFRKTIHLVIGNMEIYEEREVSLYKNIIYYGEKGAFKIDGKMFGLCHEPEHIREIVKEEKCEIIFYGHTHKPWEEEKESVKLINPGTLGGVFYKATFAVLNIKNGEVELKILETM